MDAISAAAGVISLLCSCSGGEICKLKDHQESLRFHIQALKNKRDDVTRRVDSAEGNPNEPMKCTEEVKGWLVEVQSIEGEVDKVLQKVDRLTGGTCFGNYCPLNCWSGYNLGKSVIRKLEFVNTLISSGNFAEVAYRLPPPSVEEILVDETVGMDSILENVLRLLRTDEIKILGLYGTGGVGKTTLLKRINNEFEKRRNDFDVVIWALVSNPLNVAIIQKQIGKRLGISDGNETAINISLALKNKKFMLLLDDLWERVDLQMIGIPTPKSNSKSKIVLTTRKEDICTSMAARKIRVECLKWGEAWSLFRKNVGDEALNTDTQILELAKIVAKECAGLPLVIITIGRAMSNKKKPQEWRNAVTTLKKAASEFPGMNDKVLPLLKLSYDSLPNKTIQSCFLYCSLYPEDYLIHINKVIDLWIVEGLLEGFDNITEEARDRGHDAISNLKSACLLENGSSAYYVKMHDVIRDLALWIVSEYGKKKNKFVVRQGVDLSRLPEPFKEWKDAERINLIDCQINTYQTEPPDCPNLLTLFFSYDETPTMSPISNNFLKCMPLLKVLNLSGNKTLSILAPSITGLVELEYLDLSRTRIEELPHELKNLVKLKYLDLKYTAELRKIPVGILSCLSKLQMLNLRNCSFNDWDIKEEDGGVSLGELDSLKYLVDLRITINTLSALQRLLLLLSNLHMSTTSLVIDECIGLRSLCLSPSSTTTTTTTTLSLGNMKILRHLWCHRCGDLEELRIDWMPMEEEEDQEIGLVSSLETLSLYGLPNLHGIVGDKRMAHTVRGCCCFNNLHTIIIGGCDALKDLTWLVYIRNLEELEVWNCDKIEELKRICRQSLAFPCLEEIKITRCPELKKLPLDSTTSNVNNTLQRICAKADWWNQLEWADETTKSMFLPYYFKGG